MKFHGHICYLPPTCGGYGVCCIRIFLVTLDFFFLFCSNFVLSFFSFLWGKICYLISYPSYRRRRVVGKVR